MARALSVLLGAEAAHRIAQHGWNADLFELLVGASGGAKWLILGHLDRVLFGDFLQRSGRPLTALGSSIGAWRHACLAMPDPVAAIDRLEQAYVRQHYSSRPTPAEVSAVSLAMLQQVFGADGGGHLVSHPRIHTHIVTARGRGPAATPSGSLLATALGMAAVGNGISRKLLNLQFQRVVFHSAEAPDPRLHLHDFGTHYGRLHDGNLAHALHASGSIPFVLRGEANIPGAPAGQYWDGGIIDYHFNLAQYRGDGLVLYPHFGDQLIPGWFDKFLPWRKAVLHRFDKLVLLCPSPGFIAQLPFGKIPDRADFKNLALEERTRYWATCIEHSRALAEEFLALIDNPDPLAGAMVLAPAGS